MSVPAGAFTFTLQVSCEVVDWQPAVEGVRFAVVGVPLYEFPLRLVTAMVTDCAPDGRVTFRLRAVVVAVGTTKRKLTVPGAADGVPVGAALTVGAGGNVIGPWPPPPQAASVIAAVAITGKAKKRKTIIPTVRVRERVLFRGRFASTHSLTYVHRHKRQAPVSTLAHCTCAKKITTRNVACRKSTAPAYCPCASE
jgi:hypothetical protein